MVYSARHGMAFLLRRIFIGLYAAAFLTVAVGTPWYYSHLMRSHTGHSSQGMVGCPLVMGKTTFCPMNLADHLSLWRSSFTAPLPLSLYAAAVVLALWWNRWNRRRWRERWRLAAVRWRPYWQKLSRLPMLAEYLRQAFAAGILHPKVDAHWAR